MTTRTLVVRMTTAGRLDAGQYKCDVVYQNYSNEAVLTQELSRYVEEFARANNGRREAKNVAFTRAEVLAVSETYVFLNLESLLNFGQQVGFERFSRAIEFRPDYASFSALT